MRASLIGQAEEEKSLSNTAREQFLNTPAPNSSDASVDKSIHDWCVTGILVNCNEA